MGEGYKVIGGLGKRYNLSDGSYSRSIANSHMNDIGCMHLPSLQASSYFKVAAENKWWDWANHENKYSTGLIMVKQKGNTNRVMRERTCNISWRSRGENAEAAAANDAEHSCAWKCHQRSINFKLPEGHARDVNDIFSKHGELTDLEASTFHIAQPSQLLVELVVAEAENGGILRGTWVHFWSLSPSGAGLGPTTTTLGCVFLKVLCEDLA